MLKLLVFDLDGTLADTREDLAASVNHALAKSGRQALPYARVLENVGNGARRLIAGCLAAAEGKAPNPAEVDKALADFLEHYRDHCLDKTRAYPGLEDALGKLHGRRMAVLTNKTEEASRKILAGLGLSSFFERVLGGDTGFGSKPDAGGLLHLMGAFAISPAETAMIGDGAQDAGAARAAGARMLGFLGGIAPREAMLQERPDAVFEAMEELPSAVAALESKAALSGFVSGWATP